LGKPQNKIGRKSCPKGGGEGLRGGLCWGGGGGRKGEKDTNVGKIASLLRHTSFIKGRSGHPEKKLVGTRREAPIVGTRGEGQKGEIKKGEGWGEGQRVPPYGGALGPALTWGGEKKTTDGVSEKKKAQATRSYRKKSRQRAQGYKKRKPKIKASHDETWGVRRSFREQGGTRCLGGGKRRQMKRHRGDGKTRRFPKKSPATEPHILEKGRGSEHLEGGKSQ